MHIGLSESIHDICRSKQLIHILNRLGVCKSYDEVERLDSALAQRVIKMTGNYRVPVPPSITGNGIIHGAMDNFDHEERTLSRIGGSHDTILMLFENSEQSIKEQQGDETKLISKKCSTTNNTRSLDHILEFQKLICAGFKGARGQIAPDFIPKASRDFSSLEKNANQRYLTWLVARAFRDSSSIQSIPSFPATNSLLIDIQHPLTKIAFTPIIPHPATDYDTIFTCMKNFQDVLSQKGLPYGPLWCDEGVYHVAKELQLLNPIIFDNIFLGLGGFHMEKIVLTCLGLYLEESGVEQIFVENEIYGPIAVKSVMKGSDYSLAKRGMAIIAEAMHRLHLSAFENVKGLIFEELRKHVSDLQLSFSSDSLKPQFIREEWKKTEDLVGVYQDVMKEFDDAGKACNKQFTYWHTFLFQLYPIMRDLTRSFREGLWNLYLSAVRRTIHLFFAFDRTNYCRWTPLFYEDCKNLQEKFPLLHQSFEKGEFVVRHTSRQASAVPMDQALEKEYNKPAKGPGGVIGFSKKKTSVSKWNLIKHEKARITNFLHNQCSMKDYSETSLHHEFGTSTTKLDEDRVTQVFQFIHQHSKPFDCSNNDFVENLVTGKQIDASTSEFLIQCLERGESIYDEFKIARFVEKSHKLFDKIPKAKSRY